MKFYGGTKQGGNASGHPPWYAKCSSAFDLLYYSFYGEQAIDNISFYIDKALFVLQR